LIDPTLPLFLSHTQDAKRLCRDVVAAIQKLRTARDMTVNEIRLTLAIESPLVREQRALLGVESGGAVSRDDIAAALVDVAAGKIPRDRLALKELHREMVEWPFIEAERKGSGGGGGGAGGAEASTSTAYAPPDAAPSKSPGWRSGQARPKPLGRDPTDAPASLADRLPEWMGYSALYLISAAPVLIAGSVVAILFFNSLR
jgi:hypothetical protein